MCAIDLQIEKQRNRQVGIETSRQSDIAEAMEQSTETQLLIDTVTGEVLKREQMELGSPITKVRKVTAPDQITPSTSGKPSQTRKEECIDLTNIGNTSDKEMLDDTGPGRMVKVKQEFIAEGDEYFTGLTNPDSNDDDFPSRLIICESDDCEDDDDDEHDADQIEMQHISKQQERNRNRKQVSEVDSQIKTEPDDTEDTGDTGTHHTSLETVESFTPLPTEATEEHSTIPSVTGSWLRVFVKISVRAGWRRCFKKFLFLFATNVSTHHWVNRPLIY